MTTIRIKQSLFDRLEKLYDTANEDLNMNSYVNIILSELKIVKDSKKDYVHLQPERNKHFSGLDKNVRVHEYLIKDLLKEYPNIDSSMSYNEIFNYILSENELKFRDV